MSRMGVEHEGGTATVRVHGDLDLATAEVFLAAVREALRPSPAEVTVDLSVTTFLDCAGIAALARATAMAEAAGATLAVRGAAGIVARILDLVWPRPDGSSTAGRTDGAQPATQRTRSGPWAD